MKPTFYLIFLLGLAHCSMAQELYKKPEGETTRWFSFENKSGEKGKGGMENKGAKGHAFNSIKAGETMTLLNAEGSGVITRIWMTIDNRRPEMLRSLLLQMYWDGESKPAVSVPLGDFFGIGLGEKRAFESALFSDAEGRSFNSKIPMPFKNGAKITLTNQSGKDLRALFYDVDMLEKDFDAADMLYFHAYWNREHRTELGKDFVILPKVEGTGRFLGTNVGVIANPDYKNSWFGEGEIKMYVDGDTDFPSIIGTGTEDYIGTAYGQGTFSHQNQGSLIADTLTGKYAFYRYHIPDPVYFYDGIKVDLQQIGGWPMPKVKQLVAEGAPLTPITVDVNGDFKKLFEMENPPKIQDKDFPKGWTNFYRSDDVSATAYFYLDKPTTNLPQIQPVEERTSNLNPKQ